MINYLASEKYRLFRRTAFYISSVGYLLISCGITVVYKNMSDSFFETTWLFYFSNLLITVVINFFMVVLFNSLLMGKNDGVLKQTLAFGISKQTIFLAKLLITLGVLLVVFAAGVILTVFLGETLFTADPGILKDYFISISNFLPLFISMFVFGHVLTMLQISQIFRILVLFFSYTLAGELLYGILRLFVKNEQLSYYFPSNLLAEVVNQFFEGRVSPMPENWIAGGIVVVLCLIIGLSLFNRKDF
ncbi:hypothetical protein [Enterococcus sp. AZ163]|uniref:hypothetical protein n=1 Tax=Enterococcus sp. AZ163 TaxID=2774638 RepID=UPI003D2C77FC